MLTICWAAKGGSGTTVFAAAKAVTMPTEALLVDLAGDVPSALGIPEPEGPGVFDWLASDAPSERLPRLETRITDRLSVLHARASSEPRSGDPSVPESRWFELAAHLRADRRIAVVDAGTGAPPAALAAAADESLLVTRACYLALRRAARIGAAPTGVVLVEEPGRALSGSDIEMSVGAPIVGRALLDPMIARAVDAGLLVSRLPRAWRRELRRAA